MEGKTLLGALNATLRLPGESIKQFAEQVKVLTPADKVWLAERFQAEGLYTVTDLANLREQASGA